MKDWIADLPNRGRRWFSQGLQDGFIEAIFENVKTANNPPFCVEFGFDRPSFFGGCGPNTGYLVLNQGWKCLLLDGTNENHSINLYKYFLTPENICSIFKKYEVPCEPDYVSIDVDSIDLWLFKAVLEEYKPRVVSVEYNNNFPIDAAITLLPGFMWDGKDKAYGASIKALKMVGEEFGYSIVCIYFGCDIFFVRNDLLEDGTPNLVPSFSTWAPYTGNFSGLHKPVLDLQKLERFIDYEEYVRTGDMKKSQEKATPVCKQYLTAPNVTSKMC